MTRVLTEEFNLDKWTHMHEPHKEDHVHPTGEVFVEERKVINSLRLKPKNMARLAAEDERWMRATELLIRISLYRRHKHGRIHIGDSLEFSADRVAGLLYFTYTELVVPPQWSCIVSSKVRRDEFERAEDNDRMEKAIREMKGVIGGMNEARSDLKVH